MTNAVSPDRIISKCKTWADFCAALTPLTKKQKGDAFERLTEVYLKTKSEDQSKLKNVWRGTSNLPHRVRTKIPKLPETDEGIDLIAETRDGNFWAIQSKYRTDSDKSITYREFSTFTTLAFTHLAVSFVQAVVVHSSSKPIRKRRLLGDTIEIGLQRWLQTTPEDWKLFHAELRCCSQSSDYQAGDRGLDSRNRRAWRIAATRLALCLQR